MLLHAMPKEMRKRVIEISMSKVNPEIFLDMEKPNFFMITLPNEIFKALIAANIDLDVKTINVVNKVIIDTQLVQAFTKAEKKAIIADKVRQH